jgi:hypothetical protein
MSTIVEKAKLTVDELLERRHRLHTYVERVQHALDLVYMHFETENPERIDECIRLPAYALPSADFHRSMRAAQA